MQADVTIEPLQTKKVNLGVRFIIPEKHCGLLMNKSSALTKFGIKVTLGLIDYGFNGEIETVLENTKSQKHYVAKGDSCMSTSNFTCRCTSSAEGLDRTSHTKRKLRVNWPGLPRKRSKTKVKKI